MLEDLTEISECEKKLSLNIRNDRLIGEIALSNDDINKLFDFINKIISSDKKNGIRLLETKFTTCTAFFLVWKGILDYRGGDYWSAIENSIGISGQIVQKRLGDTFIKFLKSNSLMYFEVKDAHKNLTPILAHGMIPNYYLNEYFNNILLPIFEESTNPDDGNEIKFLLRIQRQKNNEITKIEDEIDGLDTKEISEPPHSRDVGHRPDKASEVALIVADPNRSRAAWYYDKDQLDSLHKALSEYENKKQTNEKIQRRISNCEEKIREIEKEITLSSDYKLILEHLNDINQCSITLSELEIGLKELKELKALKDLLEEKIVFKARVILKEPWDDIYITILEQISFNELKKKVEEFNAVKTKELEKEKTPLNRFFKTIKNYIFYIFKVEGIKDEQFHLNEIKEMLNNLPVDEKQFTNPDELIENLELFKKDIEDISISESKINAIYPINEERIKTIKNLAITLDIDITKNPEQIVSVMQNRIVEAKNHEEYVIVSKKKISEIELKLNELQNEKLSIEDEIKEIEERFADIGNGDVQTGIERIKQCQKALIDSDSIRNALIKTYSDFNTLKREKIWTDLDGKDKNHYVAELEKTNEELHQIKLKENELNKKKNEISIPFRYVDEPTRRFLLYGNEFADNFLIESVRMVKLAREGKSSILLTEIKLPERIVLKFIEWWKQIYLFRWDEVPGRDSEIFKNFLIQNFGLDWIINAKIEKDDDNTIKVSKDSQSLLLKLNSEKTRVILTIDDIVFDEFIAKIENGRIKIYESKPVIYFDDGDGEIKVKVPPQQIDYYCNSASILMNHNRQDQHKEDLRIYKSNNNNFITEEINFSVDLPSEIYEFQLITEKETKVLNSVLGISHTHPFLVFDYKSKKLIQKNEKHEIPRCDVWIVSKETSNFEPEIHTKEDRQLVGNWSGYIARAIELKNIEQLLLCDNGNKYKIPITQNQFSKPQIYGTKLEFAKSDSKDIFMDGAPIIRIPFSSEDEIKKSSLQIFPINSELKESKHLLLGELPEIIHFKGDFCEIHLSNEKCIGNAIGEFKVRFKNEAQNIDLYFDFCVIPWMKLRFDKRIYLPHKEQNQPVSLDIDCLQVLQFEPVEPAVITSMDENRLFVKSNASEQCISGIIYYKDISIKMTVPIPRITWRLEGPNINKHLIESNYVGKLSEDEWEDAVNDKLSLIVNFPYFVRGTTQLRLNNSIGKKSEEKVRDGMSTFDLRSFTSTLREGTEPIQPFKLSIFDPEFSINDILLLNVEKWQIKDFECKFISDSGKSILRVNWNELGKTSKIVSLWQYNEDKSLLVHEVELPEQVNMIEIPLSDKIYSRYCHISIKKRGNRDSEVFYKIILPSWKFLTHINNILEIQSFIIERLKSRGDDVTNLEMVYRKIFEKKNYYEKEDEKIDNVPSHDTFSEFKQLAIEFKNNVEKMLDKQNDKKIRRKLGFKYNL